jgi:hypothetical protein
VGSKFLANGHEAWHLVLSKSNLVATCLSKREVSNTVLEWGGRQHFSILTGIFLEVCSESASLGANNPEHFVPDLLHQRGRLGLNIQTQ